jgi:16S rRNA (cytosine1402-N4)-methyltransferase
MYHQPVLLKESLDGLNITPDGIYVDATFGGGGHAKKILEQLNNGKLIAFDQDKDAEKNAFSDDRFVFIRHNFRYMKNFLKYLNYTQVDGIFADLGVSSYHFNSPERGFSFRFEGELDMRMNQNSKLTAKHIINRYPEQKLNEILREYGELKKTGRIVKAIIKEREEKEISTTQQLVHILTPYFPERLLNKHLAKVFQAFRIAVNREISNLKFFLEQSKELLKPKGRLVVISYHSIEDRLVKNFMKSGNTSGTLTKDFYGNVATPFNLINKKIITPSEEEIKQNNRARSARLRIAEKKEEQ